MPLSAAKIRRSKRQNEKNFGVYYTKEVKVLAELRSCKWLGEYGCKGFDTFGPFKLVGGIQKGHPTEEEIQGAVDFYSYLMI